MSKIPQEGFDFIADTMDEGWDKHNLSTEEYLWRDSLQPNYAEAEHMRNASFSPSLESSSLPADLPFLADTYPSTNLPHFDLEQNILPDQIVTPPTVEYFPFAGIGNKPKLLSWENKCPTVSFYAAKVGAIRYEGFYPIKDVEQGKAINLVSSLEPSFPVPSHLPQPPTPVLYKLATCQSRLLPITGAPFVDSSLTPQSLAWEARITLGEKAKVVSTKKPSGFYRSHSLEILLFFFYDIPADKTTRTVHLCVFPYRRQIWITMHAPEKFWGYPPAMWARFFAQGRIVKTKENMKERPEGRRRNTGRLAATLVPSFEAVTIPPMAPTEEKYIPQGRVMVMQSNVTGGKFRYIDDASWFQHPVYHTAIPSWGTYHWYPPAVRSNESRKGVWVTKDTFQNNPERHLYSFQKEKDAYYTFMYCERIVALCDGSKTENLKNYLTCTFSSQPLLVMH